MGEKLNIIIEKVHNLFLNKMGKNPKKLDNTKDHTPRDHVPKNDLTGRDAHGFLHTGCICAKSTVPFILKPFLLV